MLENESSHEKKKSQLRFNVSGSGCVIGGVVLLGGGLAVAGLVAAFTFIKNRNIARYDQKNEDTAAAADTHTLSEKIHDVTQGLGSVLQNPTTAVHQNSCYTNHTTPAIAVIESHMDSRELISARNTDLGAKSVAIMDGKKEDPQREIFFSDDLNKESIEPLNEETSLPAPEIIIQNNSVENLQLIQNTKMKNEDELAETENLAIEDNLPMLSEEAEGEDGGGREEHVIDKEEVSTEGEIAPKDNSTMHTVEEGKKEEQESEEEDEDLPIQLVEEEEGDDEDDHHDKHDNDDSSDEDATEKEQESSEGTSSSSRESNVEAIWPTDMIEATCQCGKFVFGRCWQ